MTGESNYWNRYGYFNFLKNINQEVHAKTIERNDYLRFFKTFKLLELLLNRDETWGTPTNGFSNTFKDVKKDGTHDSKYYLGYLWLGSLQEGENFDFKTLKDEQSSEALEMLTYIWNKDKNPTIARLIFSYYLSKNVFPAKVVYYFNEAINDKSQHCYDCFLDLKSIDFQKTFKNNTKARAEFMILYNKLIEQNKKLKFNKISTFFSFINNSQLSSDERVKSLAEMNKIYPSSLRIFNRLFQETYTNTSYSKILITALERTLAANPLSATGDLAHKTTWLGENYSYLKDETDNMFETLSKRFKNVDFKKLEKIDTKIEEWILTDLEKMIDIIHKAGAKIVIQTYPPVKRGPPRPADLLLRKWWNNRADKTNIQFMDVGLMLKDKLDLKNGGNNFYATHLGPDDNHLNQKGYELIAELMMPYVPNN